jgi:hypothetical protein
MFHEAMEKNDEHNHTTNICNFTHFTQRKTTVWVKQNVNFFQQNGSVIKIEQN